VASFTALALLSLASLVEHLDDVLRAVESSHQLTEHLLLLICLGTALAELEL